MKDKKDKKDNLEDAIKAINELTDIEYQCLFATMMERIKNDFPNYYMTVYTFMRYSLIPPCER